MAIAIRTHGESHQLHDEYTIPAVEREIDEAIRDGKRVIKLRSPSGHLIVFSIGGTAPLALEEYDPGFTAFG